MKLNHMNPLLAATLVALSVSTIAFAAPVSPSGGDQGKWSGGSSTQCKAKHGEWRQKFAKELGLSADQQTKIDALHADFKTAHKAEFDAKRAQYAERHGEKRGS
jgi:Spy/CpxP family protein refolding chaperone